MKKQLIPQLRFSEFEENWKNLRLGDLGIFKGGGTPSTNNTDYWEGDIPWISSSDVKDKDVINIDITRYLSEKAVVESATKLIPKNSVLFVSRVGVGKLFVSKNDLCTSQDFANLIPRKDNSYYIAYYFLSRNKLLHQYAQGTSIKGFTTGDLKSIPINIPSLPEQQKIASFITDVDDKITQLTKKKSLLEQYKKGVMRNIFNQELRFKDDEGNDFDDWEEKKLKQIAKIIGGGTPATTSEEYWNGNINWFTPTEIKHNRVSSSNRKITELGLKKSSATILSIGAILLTTRATIGEVAIATEECTTNQGFQSLIAKTKNLNTFIYYLIKMNKNELYKRANGSTFKEISKKEIEKITVLVPSLEEQTKIANFLSDIDVKIEALNTKIENSKTFKKGLLQKMFV